MKKARTTDELARTPISHVPREVAIQVLLQTKKVSRKSRKRFMGSIGKIVQIELAEPKDEQTHYTAKLRQCTMVQLGRRAIQAERRLRFAKGLLLVATDKNRRAIEQEISRQSYRIGWVHQEAASRIKPKKPAAVKHDPFVVTPEQIEGMKAELAK